MQFDPIGLRGRSRQWRSRSASDPPAAWPACGRPHQCDHAEPDQRQRRGGTNTGVTVALVSKITYTPFGAPLAWVWGASTSTDAVTRTYDLDGRLATYPLGNG